MTHLLVVALATFVMCSRPAVAWTGGSSSPKNAWTLQSSSSRAHVHHHKNHASAGGMTMYFDDMSRGSVDWNPEEHATSGWKSSQHQPITEQDMIQRLLTGYDAETASQLSCREVQQQTKLWTQKSGVVGNFFGDELYADLLSVSVARGPAGERAPSLVHSLAAFWQALADVITLHTDQDVWPPRWTAHARYHNLNLTSAMACAVTGEDAGVRGGDRVHMIVLPDCPALYDYQTFTTLLAAVEFSKEACVHLGRHFSLTAFHPHFKNSPTLFSPERHAPFPVVGLQLQPLWDVLGKDADLPLGGQRAVKPVEQSKTNDNGKILPPPDETPEDDEIGAMADARIRNLDDTRAFFEVLFNSAAATTDSEVGSAATSGSTSLSATTSSRAVTTALADHPTKSTSSSSTPNDDEEPNVLPEEEQLAHHFRQERQRRRGNLPPEMVRQVIALWMDEQRYADSSKRQLNPALEFMETIEGYTVCTQKMGELVYAEMWQAIRQVYERGVAADQAPPVVSEEEKNDAPKKEIKANNKNRFDLSQWMYSLSGVEGRGAGKSQQKADDDELPQVTSTIFIATKFNTYNAQAFKRFAITINAALKRITGGRMFLEVFHPEYVGNQGYNHALRRAPFPMIQICYLLQPENNDSQGS